jgi:hypothetical protein
MGDFILVWGKICELSNRLSGQKNENFDCNSGWFPQMIELKLAKLRIQDYQIKTVRGNIKI